MTEPLEPNIARLVADLESEDAFERREAQEQLLLVTRQSLGFVWSDPAPAREEAVARWKDWLKRRHHGGGRSGGGETRTVEVEGALMGLDQLKNALKGIPPEQLETHLAQILQKMQAAEAARSRCEQCGAARATVHVTEKDDQGILRERNLCEGCAAEHGDLPGA